MYKPIHRLLIGLFIIGFVIMQPLQLYAYELQQGFPSGGGDSEGGDYKVNGTIGLPNSGESSGGNYTIRSGLIFITTPGISLSLSELNITEGGSSSSYTVQLLTQPSDSVTIGINAGTGLTSSPTSLTFTTANWSTPQTVQITAQNDSISQGTHDVVINHTSSSNDGNYNLLTLPSVTAHVADGTSSSGGSSGGSSNSGSNTYIPVNEPVVSTDGQANVMPSQGGRIKKDDVVEVIIPPDALKGSQSLKIEIKKVEQNPPAPPPGFDFIGDPYEVTVNGEPHYQFEKAITLSFSIKELLLSGAADIYYYDDEVNEWKPTNGSIDDKTVITETTHLTIYAVFAKSTTTGNLTDISSHWAKDSILALLDTGAINGYPDNTFKPNQSITRAEFVSILVKALDLKSLEPVTFMDTADHWASSDIGIAASSGIVKGYSSELFMPDEAITREQMATILSRVPSVEERHDTYAFTDAAFISEWATDAIATVVSYQLMNGYPDQSFKPTNLATRAEAATVIYRLYTLLDKE